MGGHWRVDLDGWIRAEREGRDEDADARFAALLAARVPRLAPRPGLGDRVIRTLAARTAPAFRPAFPRAARVALALVLAAVGASGAIFWSTGIFSLAGAMGDALPTARTLAAASASWLGAAAHASAVLMSVARAMALAAASGPAAAVIAVNLALAFSASCALKRLLAPQEE